MKTPKEPKSECKVYLDHQPAWGGDGFFCLKCGIRFIPSPATEGKEHSEECATTRVYCNCDYGKATAQEPEGKECVVCSIGKLPDVADMKPDKRINVCDKHFKEATSFISKLPQEPAGKENFCPHGAKEKECPVLGCAYFAPASGGEKEPQDTGWEKENWIDKLTGMIEKETYLASGSKSKKHFSGKCLMDDILKFVGELIAKAESRGKIKGGAKGFEEGIEQGKDIYFKSGKQAGRDEMRTRMLQEIDALKSMDLTPKSVLEQVCSFLTSNQDKKL